MGRAIVAQSSLLDRVHLVTLWRIFGSRAFIFQILNPGDSDQSPEADSSSLPRRQSFVRLLPCDLR